MKLSDYNIIYLNLDSRKDRNEYMKDQLNNFNLKADRISAVDGKKLYNREYRQQLSEELNIPEEKLKPEWWCNRKNFKTMVTKEAGIVGRVGCFLSHLKIMKHALLKDWNNVLVFEDDVKIIDADREFEIPPESADITYFGGMYWHLINDRENYCSDWIKINTDELKIICTFSYSVNNRDKMQDIYNLCRSCFIEGKGHDKDPDWRSGKIRMRATAIDFLYINYFQKLGECHIINPSMCIADDSLGSDITSGKIARTKWKHNYYYQIP